MEMEMEMDMKMGKETLVVTGASSVNLWVWRHNACRPT